jgi:hypothetical protein
MEKLKWDRLTDKQKKKFRESIRKLRKKNSNRQDTNSRKHNLVNPVPSPQYDNVYYEGLKWLDSLSVPKIFDVKGRE